MADRTELPTCADATDCYIRWQDWNWERDLQLDRAILAEMENARLERFIQWFGPTAALAGYLVGFVVGNL